MDRAPSGTPAEQPEHTGPVLTSCILGLGYVGLPTALSLTSHDQRVLGVDISPARLARIRSGEVDLLDEDRDRLESALAPASSNSPTTRRASARPTPY